MIGDLLRAFSNPKDPRPLYDSQELLGATNKSIGEASSNLDANKQNITDFTSALNANQPGISDAVQRYTDLAKAIQSRPSNTLDDYKNLGDYLFSKVDSQATNPVINNLVSQTNLRNKVLGVNPGVDSTYDRLMRAGVASKVRLSALSDIVNNLGTTAASLNTGNLQNNAFALGLTPQEIGIRNSVAAQNLLPIYARNAALADNIQALGGLGGVNKANIYGYKQDKTGLERWADAADALKKGAWEGLSFYQSLMGGGAGGGGGMGGGGGGAGGSGNMAQLMQMFGGGAGGGGGGYGGGGNYGPPQSQVNQGAQILNGSGGYYPSPYYNYNYAPMGGYGAM